MENFSPQEIYDLMNANSAKSKKRQGISEETKAYLRQQLEQVTKQLEAEQREAKRVAALEKRRATKGKTNEQKENT